VSRIIDLDEAVTNALNLFISDPPPSFNVNDYEFPFVVGSGNAYNTGQIIFSEKAAIFADESNFKKMVSAYKSAIENKMVTQAVVISASGGKDSVWELELAKENGLSTTLLTTKENSDAAKIADIVHVFKSLDEPYTYNTSTYMGMILAATNENVSEIIDFINDLNLPENFDNYKSYAFVLPDRYLSICPMLDIKKNELFGPNLSLRAFSQGHARHAKFVIRTPDELVISINQKNDFFGDPKHRWDLNLPDTFSFAGIMAVTYYIVGKIQKSKPEFFKENVENYVNDYGPKAYGKNEPFDLIVPGTQSSS